MLILRFSLDDNLNIRLCSTLYRCGEHRRLVVRAKVTREWSLRHQTRRGSLVGFGCSLGSDFLSKAIQNLYKHIIDSTYSDIVRAQYLWCFCHVFTLIVNTAFVNNKMRKVAEEIMTLHYIQQPPEKYFSFLETWI